jgi:hypothetical protein
LFSPFWRSFFFQFILRPVFFSFEVLFFDFPCVFLFVFFFSSLKIVRINYRGEHKAMTHHVLMQLQATNSDDWSAA